MKITFIRTFLILVFLLVTGVAFSQNPNFNTTNSSGAIATGGCSPFNVNFHDQTTGMTPTSWFWDFGDLGATSTDSAPQHNYSTPGVYTVKLVINGTDSIIKIDYITVFRNPTPYFSYIPDTVCSGGSVAFLDTSVVGSAPINQWSWSFDDGSAPVIGVNSVNHTFNNLTVPIRTRFPSLLVSDTNGCSAATPANDHPVYVLQLPSASFSVGTISSCTLPATITFVNSSATGPSIYNWDFGDPGSGANNTSTQTNPSHIFTAAGDYLVTLVNGIPGCSAQDTLIINVIPPTASFIVDSIACRNDSVQFTNTSVPSSATYVWRFGDLSPLSVLKDPKHPYTNPNTYTVTLTTSVGTCSSTATQTIRVPNPPNINFTSPDHAACDTPFAVTFNADTTSMNVGWDWTFDDPTSGASNTSTLRDPVHTFNDFGSYTIKLVVTDIYGCRDSSIRTNYVQVIQPILDFTVVDSGCVGKVFTYTAIVQSPADSIITDYTWDFGDATPPVSVSTPGTTHQFNTVGIYDVTLTITTQSGCTATLTKTQYARVGTQPSAMIDSTKDTICFKGSIVFHDLTPAPVTGWLWFFGDGGSSTEQNPTHEYNIDTSGIADPFEVTLIAYYNGCPDTIIIQNMIAVHAPIPNFDIIYNCTFPDSVHFNNLTGGGDTYTWDYGDGTIPFPTDTNTDHIYSGSGTYLAVLTATNIANGCVVDTTLPVEIRNLSAVATSDSIQACRPATINFTGSASVDAVTWHWDFGDPLSGVLDTSAEADTLHRYTRTGFYLAQLTTMDLHGCVKIDTQQIHVVGPTAGFMADSLGGCVPVGVLFTDTSHTDGGAIAQRIWNFGTGGNPFPTTSDTISTTYNLPGLYTITLVTIDVNGCSDTHIATNYINPTSPTAGIILPDTGCSGSQLITGNAGPIGSFSMPVTYFWEFGDTQTFTTNNTTVNHSYSQNGSYNLRLTVTDGNGCTDVTTKNFVAYTTPAVFHYATQDTCIVESGIKKAIIQALFQSDSNAYVQSWFWDLGLVVDSDPQSPPGSYFYRYNAPPGSYDATLIVRNKWDCYDTITIPGAVIVPGPSGNFSFVPDSGCNPLTVDFFGHSSNSFTYAWDFGDGTVINGTGDSIVQHIYTTPNTYVPQFYLGFQLSNSFCYVPVPVFDTVRVTSNLYVNILEDTVELHEGETALLHVNVIDTIGFGPPYTYIWDPAANVTGPAGGPYTAIPPDAESQYYTLSMPYGITGCSAADKVLIIFNPCDETKVDTIPNVFTPGDNDNMNNTFHINDLCDFEGFYIKIFNRWGKVIWESNDALFQWDGRTNGGTEASEGVYYYVLKSRTKDLHGYVQLIRDKK